MMASSLPGPPDLISDMIQPVDLVNCVQRPAVATMEQQHNQPADLVMGQVDMLGDLPSPDIASDRLDARWFSRGAGSNGVPAGRTDRMCVAQCLQ